ncbi:hypothetical protein AUC69_07000 [Methyloceanibacter superfactus]|uniref:DUF3828 domain-containing protein n=1 Tax=Methyloceanibacter superfactus TaxID=1774969 RepID=A0A1E3W6J6_9HYPH|nr:hypothetical protein AUC69_07000 [Methyloceanibacter superfactus]
MLLVAAVSLALINLPGPLAAEDVTAAAYVESLYADRENHGGDPRYTPRLDRLWAECQALEEQTGDACVDYDMFVQGNDFKLTDLTFETNAAEGNTATVTARFKNFGQPATVVFDLLHDDKGWMIEEMTSGCATLTTQLTDLPEKC